MIKPIKNKPVQKKIEINLSAEDITVFDVMNAAADLSREPINSVRLSDIHGKMLRTNVDGAIEVLEKNFGKIAIIYVNDSKERTFLKYA